MASFAYGLRIDGGPPPAGLYQAAGYPSNRSVLLERRESPPPPTHHERRLAETRERDGSTFLTVDGGPQGSFVMAAPGHGVCTVVADGTRVECAGEGDRAAADRLLLAQALPTAAVLQGLEVLHAGAVAVGDAALAVTAPSGVGKSTVVAALVQTGARLLADDVLAVESREGSGVLAHPGPGVLALDRDGGAKAQLPHEPSPPARLRHLLFLERGPAGSELELEWLDPPDPRRLLTATFVTHVSSAARSLAQLEACAQIAATAACAVVRVPHGADAAGTAERLREATSG